MKTTKELLRVFDEAAQNWGWQLSEGCADTSYNASCKRYNEAKAALEERIAKLESFYEKNSSI